MAYHCGVGPDMEKYGFKSCEPHIKCDRCGAIKFLRARVLPPAWFRDNKAAPGWKLIRDGETRRIDYCQRCK
jgi:hypothetical protein